MPERLEAAAAETLAPSKFGKAIKDEFLFDPTWKNFNHGMKAQVV